MTTRHSRVSMLILAAAIGAAIPAFAQVQQVQTGRPMDANFNVGSGGSNRPITGYVPINGNDIISGNVSGLKYFHGRAGTADSPYTFQGRQGTANISGFARQTAGSDITNNGIGQVYYLPSSTVSTAQGGLYSAPINGGFDSRLIPRASVSPVASSAGLGIPIGSDAYRGSVSPGIDRVEGSMTLLQPGAPGALTASPLFQLRDSGERTPDMLRSSSDLGTPGTTTAPSSLNPVNPDQVSGSVSARVNGQSAELQNARVTPEEKPAIDVRVSSTYRTLLDELRQAEAEAKKNSPTDSAATPPVKDPKAALVVTELDPFTGRPRQNPTLKDPDKTAKGDSGKLGSALSTKRLDDLPLSTLQAGSRVKPMKTFVQTKAPGETTSTDVLMSRAEASLKDGRYLEAAQSYQAALAAEPNNALALVGRAHAELGAGMYQSAAYDLKFVFTRNPQLVAVRYEMDGFIAGTRQSYLLKDLATLADTKDMADTASFLLCYLDYQTNRTEELKSDLKKWSSRAGHDSWQAVAAKAWLSAPKSEVTIKPEESPKSPELPQ